jgi:hypothetical protein
VFILIFGGIAVIGVMMGRRAARRKGI